VLVTSGPTHEPIDPVRYLANRSSGKQGHAIAAAAAALGARVTLISGPVAIPDPPGVLVTHVETASEMLAAVRTALPADVGIFAAAVADWRVDGTANQKIKKGSTGAPKLALVENPDILKTIATSKRDRPKLVIGFAAETTDVAANARAKLSSKGADWIVANDVSHDSGIGGSRGVMGGDRNAVHLITASSTESWPEASKADVAKRLMAAVAAHLSAKGGDR
ncbi:MAG: bifunctional phosphopantothenoylcysteine decarboxylase/phosphopantothenate synthase, partial [Hyphomicrobiaceae bacterium]|nr:bifunctional phosphopantothenoylcysteine decarboxylase/phosphopantothenate synthase [Hyphomicrobiaceae bacterium]